MSPLEFQIDLTGEPNLALPPEIARQLPASGRATVVVLVQETEDASWRAGSYEQFLRDDDPQDAVYDRYQ